MDDLNNVGKMRNAQEALRNMLDGGYYKVLVEGHKALFDEYLKADFTREEALRLVMSAM